MNVQIETGNMKTLRFKTNINCGSCIRAVTPALDSSVGTGNWQVDTNSSDKILEIKHTEKNNSDVIFALESVGFQAQPID